MDNLRLIDKKDIIQEFRMLVHAIQLVLRDNKKPYTLEFFLEGDNRGLFPILKRWLAEIEAEKHP